MVNRTRPRPGITLLETVVALLVVAAAMAAVARTMVTVARQQQLSEQRAVALDQAANILERAQQIPWEDLDQLSEWQLPEDGPRIGRRPQMTIAMAEEEPIEAGDRRIEKRRIAVQIEWRTVGENTERVQLIAWRHQVAEEATP